MSKGIIHLTIDSNILDLAKLHKQQNEGFSISKEVESYLRIFFDVETSIKPDDNESIIRGDITKLKKELASAQAKIDIMKSNKKRLEKEKMEHIMEQVREIQERNRGL